MIDDPDGPGKVLRVAASGATTRFHNLLETTLKDGGTFINDLTTGQEYEVSFRAKWISGSNLLNTRVFFNQLAQVTTIDRADAHGTPGAANSALQTNIGPTYHDFRHGPAVPDADQAVTVSAIAEDPDGVASMMLYYAVDGGATASVTMADVGDGRYEAQIPGQPAGSVVQFYVEGTDTFGASSTFPAGGVDSRAMYQAQDGRAATNGLANLRIIMDPDDVDFIRAEKNLMSREAIGATVIFNEQEVYYDVGVRLRGSIYHRYYATVQSFVIRFNVDQLFRGVHRTVGIDRSAGQASLSEQREALLHRALGHAGGLNSEYNDLIKLLSPWQQNTGTAELQTTRETDLFLDFQYENGSDGDSFESDYPMYVTDSLNGTPEGFKGARPLSWSGGSPSLTDHGDDKEAYRWGFTKNNNRDKDDYIRLIELAKVASLPTGQFLDAVEDVLDVDQFLRAFAFGVITSVRDHLTVDSGNNATFYFRPSDGKAELLLDDTDAGMEDFNRTTLPLVSSRPMLQKFVTLPAYERLYYGHVHDILTTTMNRSYMQYWADHFEELIPAQQWTGTWLSFIDVRATFLLGEIDEAVPPIGFQITTNGGNDFSVDEESVATIEGDGWIDVREIRLAGYDQPLNVTWATETNWRVTVPVGYGDNLLDFQAYDFQGNPIGNDSITVTSTATTRPLQESLRITELNYNPRDPTEAETGAGFTDNNDFEFVELQNIGDKTLDLTGALFTDGFDFEFTAGGNQESTVLITEAGTGNTDYIEIQNVSADEVDTSGWVVVANNANYFRIGDVHSTPWELPPVMAVDEILYRPDTEEDDIFWRTEEDGWVMIVDDEGNVVDFVVWGYDSDDIATLVIDVPDGFQDITVGNAWSGAAVAAEGSVSPPNSLQRSGTSDNHDLSDWAFAEPPSPNAQNTALTVPFVGGGFELGPGEFAVITRNNLAFEARYGSGIELAGQYMGKLSNGGEQITLLGRAGEVILDFEYGDSNDKDWPERADGDGSSLEVVDPRGDYNDSDNWWASIKYGGTPGEEAMQPSVVVNEVLSHSDYPLTDAIELHNLTEEPIDVGGWWLSDSDADYQKFQIPSGTAIPGGGYVVFYEGHYVYQDEQWVLGFGPGEFGGTGEKDFALSGAEGDDVWLTVYEDNGDGDDGEHLAYFLDHVEFGAALGGESFGRWENSLGKSYLYPMTERTLDPPGANAGPRVGPDLIISELMYQPPDPDGEGGVNPDDLEFVEVFNRGSQPVTLTDWRLRKGLDFEFAEGATLDGGEALVVVRFDPLAEPAKETYFRTHYGIDGSVQIVGGHTDRLSDAGELLQLQDWDQPTLVGDPPELITPHPLEDEVDYEITWYESANGGGDSLNRLGSNLWGDDPTSWAADAPTPGVVEMTARIDGRYVFYNNSSFDTGPGKTASDAKATDKQPLLPGGTAGFANYTSYALGINGILIDVFDLKNSGVLSETDFTFKVGNDDSPASWALLETMPTIDVRQGAGEGHSDRVVLTWADNVIQNEWLEVTLKANGTTGLAAPEVFYFGNAIGETGDSTAHARVDAADILRTRNNPHPFFDPAGFAF